MVDDEDEDVLKAAGLVFDEGFDFFYSGQSDKALTAFREAYEIYRRAGVKEGQTDCLLWLGLNKMVFWGGCCGIPGWRLRSISHEDCLVRIDMMDEERDVLIGWKKRSGTLQACEN